MCSFFSVFLPARPTDPPSPEGWPIMNVNITMSIWRPKPQIRGYPLTQFRPGFWAFLRSSLTVGVEGALEVNTL